MYKLTYSPASPYVRKVRLAGYLSGLNDQIELLNPDHETHIKMKLNNPLGKIPVLMTPNNQYVFDSRVIVELLNDTSGKLYPNDDNKKIIGYGATAKSTTILNYCKINNKIVDYFVDTTPDKTNKYMPGTHIYIKKYHKNLLNNIDYIFLGAWNFKKEIFKKEKKFIKKGGRFISHIPKPNII